MTTQSDGAGGFGNELRRRRTAAGLSLGELAARVFCSRSFLSRIETGLRRVSPELARRCDEVLDAKGALAGLVPRDGRDTGPKPLPDRAGEHAVKLVGPLDGTPGPEAAFRRLLRRGDLCQAAGEMREADRHYRAAYDSARGDPHARAEAVIRMARRWSDPGQVDHELRHLIGDGLAALRGDDAHTTGLRLRLSAHLAKKLSMAVGPDTAVGGAGADEGARLAEDTLRRLPRTTDAATRQSAADEVRCEVLTECRWARYDFMPAADALALSERLRDAAARQGTPYFRGEALMALAVDQLRTGRVYSALATAQQYRKHAAESRSALAGWQQRTLDTLLDLWHGRFAAAADWVWRRSPEFTERLRADLAVPADNLRQTRLGQVYWLLREQGRLAELLGTDLVKDVEQHAYFPVWRAGLALALCETGRHAEGADLLTALAADTGAFRDFPPSGWAVPTLVLLAETCAALDLAGGHREVLARTVPPLRERLAPHGGQELGLAGWPTVLVGSTARACGLLALAAGEPEDALVHFRRATAPARTSQPELARLRLAQARALLRTGRPGHRAEAAGLLSEARRVAGAHGMALLARQCAEAAERA
ncbi:helix-turn-helix transcriptional regulator [Streptomyces sp. CRN 30]|uniref:helix-turn-helix domain-containing protein n=1 Tax=Streptomyces sp. CRN 30 TaxID=3075613 RepID=UPI002A805A07|nr:helix-turn-helix transcriptional regulator [Streptomyces sp. CRN 30]